MLFLCSVAQFSPTSTEVRTFCNTSMRSTYSSLTPVNLPLAFSTHVCIIFLGAGRPKYFFTPPLPCSFTQFITFNLNHTEYKIFITHPIRRTSLFSIDYHFKLMNKLMQGTIEVCFSASKYQGCNNHH